MNDQQASTEELRGEAREPQHSPREREPHTEGDGPRETEPAPENMSRSALVALSARLQLESLLRQPVEAVVGLRADGEAWHVMMDVIELEKVPRTCDILATYAVELDGEGELQGYRRLRRFVRGIGEEGCSDGQ